MICMPYQIHQSGYIKEHGGYIKEHEMGEASDALERQRLNEGFHAKISRKQTA